MPANRDQIRTRIRENAMKTRSDSNENRKKTPQKTNPATTTTNTPSTYNLSTQRLALKIAVDNDKKNYNQSIGERINKAVPQNKIDEFTKIRKQEIKN